ncbi:GNAT family N-acetyltransferase [Pseudochrobactrum sp. B5]|uniref:GNAT family N-acetyltransferase n=1 Tax=Pseudochrobactrum sp. B5 TaxID=1289478 RepID=UPI000952AF02|nr:GNAT family N-acetyltransferase [Pseudochrobactrum sp. B5]
MIPEIETTRMILRPFRAEDADEIWPCMTANLARYMRWEPPERAEDFEKIWRKWPMQFAEESNCIFIARKKVDHSFIGLFGMHSFKTPTPRLGLWVREELHRQGFGPEGIVSVMNWARGDYSPDYFIYPVAEENIPSRKLVESLGGKAVTTEQDPKFTLIIYHIPA